MSKILGFDCSSTTLAYAVLDVNEKSNNIKYITSNYIKPIKAGSIIQRLVDTRNKIKSIVEEIKPDYIVIEDIIKFMAGASSATTIIRLTEFNRMICLLSYDYLSREPELLSVMTIRHKIKKCANLGKLPHKEELPVLLEKLLNINFPWLYNKKNGIKVESYDKSDAICCAYVYALKLIDEKNMPKT
jgi:Holliday junction resolvasome RuvABC endonuclease subunit